MIELMEPKIVFEDEEILVLDKPAGMVVNRAETTRKGETVQEWVEEYIRVPRVAQVSQVPQEEKQKARDTHGTFDSRGTFFARAGIVHRLDKETSGLLLVAKTPEAFEELQRQFKERKVEKRYLALVAGEVKPEEGEINAPVGRLPWDRKKFGVFPGGRVAQTKYKVLNYYTLAASRYSLLELSPHTGRTHQIRVHLKYLGYPIVADAAYGGRKKVRQERKLFPRMFLHASSLKFKHPKTGKEETFESKLPSELELILKDR